VRKSRLTKLADLLDEIDVDPHESGDLSAYPPSSPTPPDPPEYPDPSQEPGPSAPPASPEPLGPPLFLDAVAAHLRVWADRLERHARQRRRGWNRERPSVGGKPRPPGHLDEVSPPFVRSLIRHFAGVVSAARRIPAEEREPDALPASFPSGEVLAAGYLSGGPGFAPRFRRRFAEAARSEEPPRIAAAMLVLWAFDDPDSPDAAERLLDRLRKGGKPRPKK